MRDAADLGRTLDHDLGDRRLRQLLDDVLADLEVLEQQPAVILAFREPAAVPGPVDLQAKPDQERISDPLRFFLLANDDANAAERLDDAASSGRARGSRSASSRSTCRRWPRRRPARRRRGYGCSRHWRPPTRAPCATSSAMPLGENFRMLSASSTLRPRIRLRDQVELARRATDRVADRRALPCRRPCAGLLACSSALALLVGRVAVEGARRRELAELHADHVLIDRHRHELAAVVDIEGQADELRQDRRTARPGLDRRALAACPARLPPSSAAKARRTDLSRRNGPWLNPSSSRDATG